MKQDVFDLLLSAYENKILYRHYGSSREMQEDWQKIMKEVLVTSAYVAVPTGVMEDLVRKIKQVRKNALTEADQRDTLQKQQG